MPPGSGVPVPGRDRRVEHVDVDRQEHRARADDPGGAADRVLDAERRDVVHEQRRDPLLALPGELLLARPVAAQADLDVAGGLERTLLDEPPHPRPVRALDAEYGLGGVGVGVEVHEPDGAVAGRDGADLGLGDRVVAAEHDRDRARVERPRRRPLDGRVRGGRIGGQHGSVAEVDDPQHLEGVDAGGEVASRRAAGGADRARSEAAARAVGDEVVGRGADDRDVDAGEVARILGVGRGRRS